MQGLEWQFYQPSFLAGFVDGEDNLDRFATFAAIDEMRGPVFDGVDEVLHLQAMILMADGAGICGTAST